jgi:hypothetical protein
VCFIPCWSRQSPDQALPTKLPCIASAIQDSSFSRADFQLITAVTRKAEGFRQCNRNTCHKNIHPNKIGWGCFEMATGKKNFFAESTQKLKKV